MNDLELSMARRSEPIAKRRPASLRYAVAIALVALAFLCRLSLDPFLGQESHPYATFYIAVALAEFLCGFGPALVVLFLGLIASLWFIVPPRDAIVIRGLADAVEILLYFFVNGTILFLMEWLQKARQEAAANALLARQKQGELEADIAARLKAEEALQESEQRFRSLAENLQDAVWLSSIDSRKIWYVNPAYGRIWGRSAGALTADAFDWMHSIHNEDRLRVQQAFQRAGEIDGFELEYRLHRPDGSTRWVRSRGFPIRTAGAKLICTAHIAEDITVRKQMERARAKNREELERLVGERTARLQDTIGELEHFSYALTHDMRAPLRAMRSYAELVKELCPPTPTDIHEYCRRIITAAERLDLLICDSLNYAKVVRADLPSRPVDLGKLIADIINTYPNLELYQAHIQVVGELPVVLGHEAGLTQCFSNLLSNAVKFLMPGRPAEIRIWAEPRERRVRINVEDNGIGIPRSAQHRLFGMFQRLTNQNEGTGIGLAIVRKVVERMGGTVGAISEPGQGSRFWIELSLAKSKAAPCINSETGAPQVLSSSQAAEEREANPIPTGAEKLIKTAHIGFRESTSLT
jgi:PAS domain S-box-containing protein